MIYKRRFCRLLLMDSWIVIHTHTATQAHSYVDVMGHTSDGRASCLLCDIRKQNWDYVCVSPCVWVCVRMHFWVLLHVCLYVCVCVLVCDCICMACDCIGAVFDLISISHIHTETHTRTYNRFPHTHICTIGRPIWFILMGSFSTTNQLKDFKTVERHVFVIYSNFQECLNKMSKINRIMTNVFNLSTIIRIEMPCIRLNLIRTPNGI